MGLLSTFGAASGRAFGLTRSAIAAATDAFFNRVSLLLNTSSTNGAQNNTFLDSSSYNFTITRNGNTTQGTFTPFSQTGWSVYSNGAAYNPIYVDAGTACAYGTGDFTIELFFYSVGTTSANQIIFDQRPNATNGLYPTIYLNNASGKLVYQTNSVDRITADNSFSFNAWTHIVVSRVSGTTRMFINGTQQTTTYADTNNYLNGTNRPILGHGFANNSAYPNGYYSNVRVLKGTGVTSVTVPTSKLENIPNTSLLICQSNRFVDNSTANSGSGFTVLTSGTPSVQAFSPFAPTAAYSTSVVGGSGYFDGTGDYLTVANNAALQITNVDWTVESWIYLTTLPASTNYQAIAQKGRSANSDYEYFVAINNNSGNYRIYVELSTTGSNVVPYNSSNINLSANSWNHVAVSKSGTTLYYFFNGVAAGTSTITSATGWFTGTGVLGIGANNNGGAYLVTGYLSGTRITKGGALYTTAFSAPTAPPTTTVSAGTVSLLLNATNAGIYDAAAINVSETVGNAQVSTTQAKFGSTSMYFDGTGDYLILPYNKRQDLTQGDFTIEGWFYRAATGVEHNILNNRFTTGGLLWRINAGNTVSFALLGQATVTSTGTIAANTWTYIAVTRSGANLRIFINGTIDGSSSTYANGTSSTTVLRVGCDENLTNAFNGYMDELRVTNGYARYTANFSVPTAPFPVQ